MQRHTDADLIIRAHAVTEAQSHLGNGDPKHASYANKMGDCLRAYVAKNYAEFAVPLRSSTAHQRCGYSQCAFCAEPLAQKNVAKVAEHFNKALGLSPNLNSLRFTAMGPRHPLSHAKECVSRTIEIWRAFTSSDAIHWLLAAHVRGISFELDHFEQSLRPVVRAVLLINPKHLPFAARDWKMAWETAATNSEWSATAVRGSRPSFEHDQGLAEFVGALARTGIAPEAFCESTPGGVICDPEKFKLLKDALTNRNLFWRGAAKPAR